MLSEKDEVLKHMETCPYCELKPRTSGLICCVCNRTTSEIHGYMYLVICESVELGFAICHNCLDKFLHDKELKKFRKSVEEFKERVKHGR